MNYIERINNLVKERKIQAIKDPHYNALEYNIIEKEIDLFNPNKIYQVNLNFEIGNLNLRNIKSDWLLNVDEAKYQCCEKVYEFLIIEPSVRAMLVEKKSLINGITLRLIIVLSILLSLMLLVPILFYFLLPFSFSIILLLSVPYILYRNNRILKSIGEKEDGVVRKCKSFDFFECPITNVNKGDLFIDLSNSGIENQDVSKDNFIAKAENNINLDLVPTQINSHKIKIYTFQKDSHLRIRKSANGFYTCTMRILLVDGLELTYFNPNVPKESFTETDFPLLKVMSQYGVHYFPYNLSDPVEMREIEKYQTIIEIHFNQLISFNIKNLFK
ncbi:hypothetical protein ACTFIU_000352 [Dictyostelium citrinum]